MKTGNAAYDEGYAEGTKDEESNALWADDQNASSAFRQGYRDGRDHVRALRLHGSSAKHWDEMQPRERDAWIAERVMGWTDVDTGKFMASLRDVVDGVPVWNSTDHSGIPDCGGGREFVPHFTTDPAADYLVLEKVRGTWQHRQQVRFAMALNLDIWSIRCSATRTGDDDTFLEYLPGDYSHAAYLALTDGLDSPAPSTTIGGSRE